MDMGGRAVGVNSAVIAGAQGIGFAVPIDLVKIMLEMLKRFGRYVRPRLGVYVAALNKALAAAYGLPIARGLLVAGVYPGSPAERLGIRPGDVIVKVDGRAVSNVFELRLFLAEAVAQGREPAVTVWRAGREVEL